MKESLRSLFVVAVLVIVVCFLTTCSYFPKTAEDPKIRVETVSKTEEQPVASTKAEIIEMATEVVEESPPVESPPVEASNPPDIPETKPSEPPAVESQPVDPAPAPAAPVSRPEQTFEPAYEYYPEIPEQTAEEYWQEEFPYQEDTWQEAFPYQDDTWQEPESMDYSTDWDDEYDDYERFRSYIDAYSTVMIVEIEAQHAYCFVDGECLGDTDCVTGDAWASPTPTGTYSVWYKRYDFNMLDDPKYYTLYATFFNNGIAIHDADAWRSEYGGTIYQGNGSHGCVNTPRWFSELVYCNTEIGTKVVVLP